MREQAHANQRPSFGAVLSNCNVSGMICDGPGWAAFHPTAPLVRRHGMATLGSARCHHPYNDLRSLPTTAIS
jgi:hypothetical protein